MEFNESLALLVELDNKIPQSPSLLKLPFGHAKSVSLQLTINLLYKRY